MKFELFTLLEKSFEIKSKEELEALGKPNLERQSFPYPLSIPLLINKECNMKYSSPEKSFKANI